MGMGGILNVLLSGFSNFSVKKNLEIGGDMSDIDLYIDVTSFFFLIN